MCEFRTAFKRWLISVREKSGKEHHSGKPVLQASSVLRIRNSKRVSHDIVANPFRFIRKYKLRCPYRRGQASFPHSLVN